MIQQLGDKPGISPGKPMVRLTGRGFGSNKEGLINSTALLKLLLVVKIPAIVDAVSFIITVAELLFIVVAGTTNIPDSSREVIPFEQF
jgi:hypothetical protein